MKGNSPEKKRDSPNDTQAAATPTHPREERRKSKVGDEKQRSKRLFGALLGNLNQPSDRASKRRAEIEERRKAELQRLDDEKLALKAQRLERLAEHRKRAQRDVDEEAMRVRHRNMLERANFLLTETEPRVYYRPWELREEEEERVERQVKEAQAEVDREVEESEARRRGEEPRGKEDKAGKEGQAGDGAVVEETAAMESGGKDELEKGGGEALPEAGGSGGVAPAKTIAEGASNTAKVDEVPDSQRAEEGQSSSEKVDAEDNVSAKEARKDEQPGQQIQHEQNEQPEEQEHQEMEDEGDHVVEGDEDTVIY